MSHSKKPILIVAAATILIATHASAQTGHKLRYSALWGGYTQESTTYTAFQPSLKSQANYYSVGGDFHFLPNFSLGLAFAKGTGDLREHPSIDPSEVSIDDLQLLSIGTTLSTFPKTQRPTAFSLSLAYATTKTSVTARFNLPNGSILQETITDNTDLLTLALGATTLLNQKFQSYASLVYSKSMPDTSEDPITFTLGTTIHLVPPLLFDFSFSFPQEDIRTTRIGIKLGVVIF